MTVEKPKPKLLLRPISKAASTAMNQSELLAITCNLLKAREKLLAQSAIGLASHWMKDWSENI